MLQIYPNVGCYGCESGNYYLQHIASVNNAITNVEFVEEFEDDCYYEHYIDIYDTDGNGYYGTGYTINVYIPDED